MVTVSNDTKKATKKLTEKTDRKRKRVNNSVYEGERGLRFLSLSVLSDKRLAAAGEKLELNAIKLKRRLTTKQE